MNPKNTIVVLILILCASILLAACSSNSTSMEPATRTAQLTATMALTHIPANTVIPTVNSTATLLPTATYTPVPTSTPTQTLTPKPTSPPPPTSTPASIPTSSLERHVGYETISPNGKWVATADELYTGNSENSEERDIFLRVNNAEDEIEWIIERYRTDIWLARRIVPVFWSQDSQYLYFSHSSGGDGCFSSGPYSDLLRLDVQTGEITKIEPHGSGDYVVSPNGDSVAYTLYDGSISIYNFASENTRKLTFYFDPEPRNISVRLVWSPDGSMIMAQIIIDSCIVPREEAEGSVIRVNVATLNATVLLDNDGVEYSLRSWSEADAVQLKKDNGQIWIMNPFTGDVVLEE